MGKHRNLRIDLLAISVMLAGIAIVGLGMKLYFLERKVENLQQGYVEQREIAEDSLDELEWIKRYLEEGIAR